MTRLWPVILTPQPDKWAQFDVLELANLACRRGVDVEFVCDLLRTMTGQDHLLKRQLGELIDGSSEPGQEHPGGS